eukprot:scaffold28421_cov19-Tisochrysis_lutea.AAC.1
MLDGAGLGAGRASLEAYLGRAALSRQPPDAPVAYAFPIDLVAAEYKVTHAHLVPCLVPLVLLTPCLINSALPYTRVTRVTREKGLSQDVGGQNVPIVQGQQGNALHPAVLSLGMNMHAVRRCALVVHPRSQKDVPLKERLLDALSQNMDDDKVMSLLTALAKQNPTSAPARSPKAGGRWRLIWSQQSSDASPLQKWGSKQ